MLTTKSKNNVKIHLRQERWEHIISRHPEMSSHQSEIMETVQNPDMILEGGKDELLAIKFYEKTSKGKKYLQVAYKEVTANYGFVVTAMLLKKVTKNRRILWQH